MKTFVAIVFMALAINTYAQEDTFCPAYIFDGFIENGVNQRQGIKVNFTILSDSILIGSYSNKTLNVSSKIVGHLNDDNTFNMVERDRSDNITGIFKGKLSVDNTSAQGQWSSPLNDQIFLFEFIKNTGVSYNEVMLKNKNHQGYTNLQLAIKDADLVKSIEVENLSYKTLPKKLGRLTSIESINLGGNKFQMFPLVLFKLTTLDEINLTNNRIKYVSSSIGDLKNLRLLKLNNNKLKYIPKEIGALSNLLYLDLSNNKLTSLPVEIKHLLYLQELHLQGNNFSIEEQQKITMLLPNCSIYFN